jgi:hypothetical protein
MSESVLITPRRNFLVRALGFTVAGAAMSVPIITVANAKARIDHHTAELEKAFRDYYAGMDVEVIPRLKSREKLIERPESTAVLFFLASAEPPGSTAGRAGNAAAEMLRGYPGGPPTL